MSHPAYIRRIAVNLVLPPNNMETSRVAAALEIPYQTIHKWKTVALAAQVGTKRQGKSTTTNTGLKRASRIKKDPSSAASLPTRTRSRPNEDIRASSTEGGHANSFNLVGKRLINSMPLSMFSP